MSLQSDLVRDEKAIYRYFTPFDSHERIDRSNMCDPMNDAPPQRHEVAAALVLHWLRMRKKSVKWCREMNCYPGPAGHVMKRNGWWMPAPHEACLCQVKVSQGEFEDGLGSVKWHVQPFAWWHHCKTYEHCLFIVRNRRLQYFRVPDVTISRMAAVIANKVIPTLTGSTKPLYRCFLLDWADGMVDDIDSKLGDLYA